MSNTAQHQFPLSLSQRGIYFLQELDPENTDYNVILAGSIKGQLKFNQIKVAVKRLIESHEILRTTFSQTNGVPCQVIHDEAKEVPVERTVLLENDQENFWSSVSNIAKTLLQTPFDLEKGPLFQIRLVENKRGNLSALLICFHHIIADGWSMHLIIDQLSKLYQEDVATIDELNLKNRLHYADFSIWQNDFLKTKQYDEGIQYWKKQLSNLQDLDLPFDFPRTKLGSSKAITVPFNLGHEVSKSIRQIALDAAVTPYVVMLALMQLFTSYISGQQDIAIGTAVWGRHTPELETVVGQFVNPIVLRAHIDLQWCFNNLLINVEKGFKETLRYQSVPFEKIVEQVNPERVLNRNPLFQVNFVFQNLPEEPISFGKDISLIIQDLALHSARYDLEVQAWHSGDNIEGIFIYAESLFSQDTTQCIKEFFTHFVSQIVFHPQKCFSALTLIPDAQSKLLTCDTDQSHDVETEEFLTLFSRVCKESPKKQAIVKGGESITFKALDIQSNQIANFLQMSYKKAGLRVGILAYPCPEFLISIIAILKLGWAYVPLDPNHPVDRLQYIVNDAEVAFVINTTSSFAKQNPAVFKGIDIVNLYDKQSAIDSSSKSLKKPRFLSCQTAYILYTSGSTGWPKGVCISRESLNDYLAWCLKAYYKNHKYAKGSLVYTAIGFDLIITGLIPPLLVGEPVFFPEDPCDKNALLSFMKKAKSLNVLKLTPSHLKIINEFLSKEKMGSITKTLVVGGEDLTFDLIEPWLKSGVNIYNEYGPTEATVGCVTYKLDSLYNRAGKVPIGNAIDRCNVYVLNQELQRVPFGVVGEIYLSANQLATGYIRKPKQTADVFIPNPFSNVPGGRLYKTGDLARYSANGVLELIGRTDLQVKINGYRIELEEIRLAFLSCPEVNDAVVFASHSKHEIICFIQKKSNVDPSAQSILNVVRTILPEYMIPRHLQFIECIPLTVNGKQDIPALLALYEAERNRSRDAAVVKPNEEHTGLQLKLLAIWEQVLDRKDISIDDNFFELGGDSIQALQIVNHAQRARINMTATDMLEHQSIRTILLHTAGDNGSPADPRDFKGDIPLTPIQHWFFEHRDMYLHHYNQSILLKLNHSDMDWSKLEQILNICIKRHDTFRIRYIFQKGKWQQCFTKEPQFIHIELVDIDQGSICKSKKLKHVINAAHRSLDIEHGPVIKAFGITSHDQKKHLMLIAHHLYVDGVSWRILIDDMTHIAQDATITMPSIPTTFKTWSRTLAQFAQNNLCDLTLENWQAVIQGHNAYITVKTSSVSNTQHGARHLKYNICSDVMISLQNTLIQKGVALDKFLVIAFSYALRHIIEGSQLCIDLESFGRDLRNEGHDFSGVVGWFTSIYPVLLKVFSDDVLEHFCQNYAALSRTPDPITFGLLKYSGAHGLEKPSEVLFNFLGVLDSSVEGSLFSIVPAFLGEHRDPDAKRDYIFEVNAFIYNGELHLIWEYHDQLHAASQIEACITRFENYIDTFLSHADEMQPVLSQKHVIEQEGLPNLEERYLPFPLTDVQQAYWVGRSSALEMGGVSCHIYQEVMFPYIDKERLTLSLNTMIQRHEMLRAIINNDGTQCILETPPMYKINMHDLEGMDPSKKQGELTSIRDAFSHKVRNPQQWPLFDVQITRLDTNYYIVHFSFDLLIVDGWSISMIGKELFMHYHNSKIQLPALSYSFRDYVIALKKLQQTIEYDTSLAYWQREVETLPAGPELPVKNGVELNGQHRFLRKTGKLSAKKWGAIKAKAEKRGLTPSIILLTIYSEVIGLWSATQDFTLNLTLYNRYPFHPDVPNIAGDFTTLSLLPVRRKEGRSFYDQASALQKHMWKNMEHSIVDGVEVLRQLNKKRGYNTVLMPVVFTSALSFDLSNETGIQELEGEVLYTITQTPQVWLDHQVFEDDGALVFYWDYVEGLFEHNTIDQMFECYQNVLHYLDQDAHFLDKKYYACYLQNATNALDHTSYQENTSKITLYHLFEAAADLYGGNTAILSEEASLSYNELKEHATALASEICAVTPTDSNIIAIMMEKSWQQVVAVLAVIQAGYAYMPIDPTLPPSRVSYLLSKTNASTVIVNHISDMLPVVENVINPISVSEVLNKPTQTSQVSNRYQSLAYVLFTSGSTGEPKGVMINHASVINTILSVNEQFSISNADNIFALSSLSFDLSVYDIFGALCTGASVVIPDAKRAKDPSYLLECINQYKVTVWNSVPMLFDILLDHVLLKKEKFNSLRIILLSGDWIPLSLPEKFWSIADKHKTQLISLGGATECSIWSIYYVIKQIESTWKSIPYGIALPNQGVQVLNYDFCQCPVGVVGEIYISGSGLALGYLGDETKTKAHFIVHPITQERLYVTGDWGRYLPDGNIEFIGRKDLQVKIRGYRVELNEIKHCILNYKHVQQVCVVPIKQYTDIAACLVVDNKAVFDTHHLKEHLQACLPPYMVPSKYHLLDTLPLTPTGKLDTAAVAGLFEDHSAETKQTGQSNVLSVGEDISSRIKTVIQEVTKISNLTVTDNLLEKGINSIDVVMIVNQLEEIYGCRPPLNTFFSDPTIQAISNYYQQKSTSHSSDMKLVEEQSKGWLSTSILPDEISKQSFKLDKKYIRKDISADTSIDVGSEALDDSFFDQLKLRFQVNRKYLPQSIKSLEFFKFVNCLNFQKKSRLYPSAGGLYPIQIYFSLKNDAVEGLEGGAYYYHPEQNKLYRINECGADDDIHDPFINKPIAQGASFTLFLVAYKEAIAPVYQQNARDYCLLESGHVGQLLMYAASFSSIGLCPIGQVDTVQVARLLSLDSRYEVMYTFLGGAVESNSSIIDATLQSVDPVEYEEGQI